MNPVQRIGDQPAEVIQIDRGLKGVALEQAAIGMLRAVPILGPKIRMGNQGADH